MYALATINVNSMPKCSLSSTPNIEPRMINVNGGMRIGFFAKHDIDAQSEVSTHFYSSTSFLYHVVICTQ